MRIGITVRARRGQQLWRDGESRHALVLAALFAQLPFVRAVMLIDVRGERAQLADADCAVPGLRTRVPIVGQQQASDQLDVVVDVAGGLDPAWVDAMRSRGGKLIGCRSVTAATREAHSPSLSADRHDALWLLPKDELTLPLARTRYRCPVQVVPCVWSSAFVERRMAALEQRDARYGYRTPRPASGWRVAAWEPDLPPLHAPGIALLACEAAYRMEHNEAEAVSAVHVLNAAPMKAAAARTPLAQAFDLVRDERAVLHGPHDPVDFVARHADAVFVHQQDDGDAYGYLDVLYGGYPLIHNSPWLLDAGYYYPGDDAQQGARVLLAALHCHDATLDAYRVRSRAVFDAMDPNRDANRAAYAHALSAVLS